MQEGEAEDFGEVESGYDSTYASPAGQDILM